jgi:hypothetical protein
LLYQEDLLYRVCIWRKINSVGDNAPVFDRIKYTVAITDKPMLEVFTPIGKQLVPYTPEISIALIACFLVLIGGEINRLLRRVMVRQHFILRTLAFILLNAFGYGLLIVKATPHLSQWLRSLQYGTLFSFIAVCFIAIGLWAQKHRHV